jgi:diguanylate cyclase (GGDEF)-like protein
VGNGKIRILVVAGQANDHDLIVDLAARDRKNQYEVTRAENDLAVAEKTGENRFDLCILDSTYDSGGVPDSLAPAIRLLESEGDGYAPGRNVMDVLYKSTLTPEIFSRVTGYTLERKRLLDKIETLSHYDSLTHLPNESLFQEYFDFYFENAKRKGRILALLVLDIDNLRKINDTYGQSGGDGILMEMASRLKTYVRKIDPVSRATPGKETTPLTRIGGDEFLIVMGELRHGFDAARVAARILKMIQTPFMLDDRPVPVSANIGIALYPQDGSGLEVLKGNAAEALRTAKKLGKNTYHHFDRNTQVHSVERLDLEAEIREAVDKDELMLYYQPQLSLNTFKITSMEAFLRVKRKDGKILPASRFIYLLEEMNLINDAAERVIRLACRHLGEWRGRGITPPVISINLSPRQIGQKNFLGRIFSIVNEYGLPIRAFAFEITEQSLEEENDAVKIINQLEAEGFRILIDDFGSGSSTLNNLRFLPVEGIKIDQSFMKPLTREKKDCAIVRSIIDLGRFLKIEVVAKRVEKAEQFVFLREAGCDMAQGEFICHPLPADEIAKILLDEQGAN